MSRATPFIALLCCACLGDITELVPKHPGTLPSLTAASPRGPGAVSAFPAAPPDAGPLTDAGTTLIDDATVVTSTFPSTLNCNQSVMVTVTVHNNGTSTWTKALGFYLGAVGDSDPYSPSTRAALDDNDSVPPGGEHTFTVTLNAGATASTGVSDWQMLRDGVHWFGGISSTSISVACAMAPPFDLNQVTIEGSPDVRGFAVTSELTSLEFSPGDIHIDHTKRGQWPGVVIDPTDGTTQEATIWVFFNIGGAWYGTGGERLRPNQTDKQLDQPSSIGPGWLYDSNRWGPMTNYVPQPGELVGFMVVAGSTRSDNNVIVQERSKVVLVQFPSDGVTTTFPPFYWVEP